ncbi:LexA family protein [Enterobacteriaceae bacterium LUAb1]
MNFDDSFSKRVAIARNAAGLTQDELAKKVGVVRRQIAAYEGAEARPRSKALENLAAALGTTSEWLASGSGQGPDIKNIRKTVTLREIPVINHMQVKLNPNSSFLDEANIVSFIPAPMNAGENSFAVLIEGESMDSPKGLSFPDGTIVTFDPDINVTNGDYVLCGIYNEMLLTFKQYVKDQGVFYLKSLNPEYPAIHFNEFIILGVAVHSQTNLSIRHQIDNNHPEISAWDSSAPLLNHDYDERLSILESKIDKILKAVSKNKPT